MRNKNKFLEDGIILLNKEKNISSFSAINKLKWLLNVSKIGHAGTLDPMAEGLLVVMVNSATKFSDDLMKKDKEYYVEMVLGYETDTYDNEGIITKKYNTNCDLKNNLLESLSQEDVIKSVMKFVGEIEQEPPMYSAIKVNGEKLYNLARQGIEVERKLRKIKIDYIKDINYNSKDKVISFYTKVSSGTYIRSLVKDIGDKLGTYATMIKLVRTQIDKFLLEDSILIDNVVRYFENNNNANNDKIFKNEILKFKNIEDLFEFEKIIVNEEEYRKLKNGMTVLIETSKIKEAKIDIKYKVYFDNSFVGVVKVTNIGTDKIYLKKNKYFL